MKRFMMVLAIICLSSVVFAQSIDDPATAAGIDSSKLFPNQEAKLTESNMEEVSKLINHYATQTKKCSWRTEVQNNESGGKMLVFTITHRHLVRADTTKYMSFKASDNVDLVYMPKGDGSAYENFYKIHKILTLSTWRYGGIESPTFEKSSVPLHFLNSPSDKPIQVQGAASIVRPGSINFQFWLSGEGFAQVVPEGSDPLVDREVAPFSGCF